MEFATVYAALGTKVTILEAMPKLVPNMDKDISENLKMILKKRGIDITLRQRCSPFSRTRMDISVITLRKKKSSRRKVLMYSVQWDGAPTRTACLAKT